MAFIKSNPRSGYVYYNVVESVRKDGVPQHEDLYYIGRLDDISPDERREIEVDLAEIDPSLLPDFYDILVDHDYDFTADPDYQAQYPLEEITPTEAVDYGPVAALHAIAEKLELRSVLEAHLQPKGGGPPLGDLLLIQIIARCLEPRSIDATTDWYPLTALPGLLDLSAERITSQTFYNSLDYVDEDGIERVHEELWTHIHDLYDTPTDPLFYDLTSSYFEGTVCPLTDYGHSSEHRPDKQQLVMGVTVNPDMVPLHHDVYPGNTTHSKTVDDAVERIDERGITDPTLVMDKGCATNPNREDLRDGEFTEDGTVIDYVVARKNQGDVERTLAEINSEEFDPVELPEGASPLAVTEADLPAKHTEDEELEDDEEDKNEIRWVATYNEQKAVDDAEYRETQLDRAGEELDELVERQHGDRPLSKQELLSRTKRVLKNRSVTDLVEIDVNERGPPRLSWEVDEEGIEEAAKLDGKALFETTRTAEELSAAAVARAYRDRDTVEKFMESIKDTANLRPHYVYTEQHVRARVFICVLSVLLIATLQLELEDAGKEMTGVKALETLRGVRRVEFSVESSEAVVVKTTELSDEQEELAHVFDFGT
jgi:transposase